MKNITILHKIRGNYRNIIFILLSILVLQLSFNHNFFNAAYNGFFNGYQKDSEALVISKIINSQYENIFNEKTIGWSAEVQETFELYTKNIPPINKMINYDSSFGLQGYIYSIVDKFLNILNIDPINKLGIIYFITSFIMSLSFSIFGYYVKKEFGLIPATLMILGILYSQWLVVFAKNIYWMFFLIINPFIYSWISLQNRQENKILSHKVYFIIFVLILLKSLAGFEYLSTIFISLIIPYIYFSIKNEWAISLFIKRIFFMYLYAFCGFLTAVTIYIIQKAIMIGSLTNAVNGLLYIIKKRTYSNPNEVEQILKESLESSVTDVILKYWYGNAVDLNSIFGKFTFITFNEIILFFALTSILFLFLYKIKALTDTTIKKQIALLIATWIAILAPLSWYILAKGHSYIHTHMNHVLWYVPFLVLVFVFIGYLFQSIKYKKFTIKNYIYMSLILFLACITYLFISDRENDKKISFYLENNINLKKLENGLIIAINPKLNKIVYFYEDCKNKDLDTRFFLHIVPVDNSSLPEYRRQYNFDNFDFAWQNFEVKTTQFFSKYRKSCISTREMPNYTMKSITTGQYNSEKRIWQTGQIDIIPIVPKMDSIHAFNLSDGNWQNGISKSIASFFINNDIINKNSLKIEDKLLFANSGIRTIKNITYSAKYINIYIDGEKLDPIKDGYPNKIKIIGKE